jgi:LysM repeat protein
MEVPMSRNLLAIRIWLILTVIAVSLMGTSAFAQSGATVVRVDPSALSAQVNDHVNLSIKVDNISNLTALELHLSFNSSVLEVLQVTNGGFVAADFTAQNIFDNTAGTIDYAIAQMNRPAAQGSGTLLNITFRAKSNGNSSVTLRATQAVPSGLLLSDSNGMAIQASWIGGSVTVGTPIPPTSIPPTSVPPTSVPPTSVPPTSVPPTSIPPTSIPPTSIPPATPLPGSILGTHVVRWGEFLYCIGRAYGVQPWAIAQVNGVWWPYIIFPNQSLLIPNVPWSPIPAGPVCKAQFTTSVPTSTPIATTIPTAVTAIPSTAIPATVVPPSACRAYYIVRPGDNLFRIGLQYGVSYWELARVNQISNPTLIYPGQKLCIP